MDSRFNRPSSPGSRRLNQPFRSSTGTLIYPSAYDPYYAPLRSSRESVSGPRSSTERVLNPRPVTRTHKDDLPQVRRAYDDYNVAPRRSTLDPFAPTLRTPLSTVSGSGTASPSHYRPVVTTAGEKSASPLPRYRVREDEPYYIQPASSLSSSSQRDAHRNYSADSKDIERYLAGDRDLRDRSDRNGYRGTTARGAYNINVPSDRGYGYEYTDRREQMYQDTAPRPRQRRESISGSVSGNSSGRRERPISMTGMEDYLPKVSSRETGPPVSTRGFDKIERAGSLRQNYQSRENDTSSRDYAIARGQDDSDSLQRRRSTKAPVAVHQDQDDGYSSYREERSEPHRKHRHHHHKSRRDESSDRRGDDRGQVIRNDHDEDSRRDTEEKARRRRESRKDRDEIEEKDRRPRDDHHGEKHRHREDFALGATSAAAAGLIAEGIRHRHDRERNSPDKDVEKRDRKRDVDRDRTAVAQPLSESSGPSGENSDDDRREQRRQRRKGREAKEQEAYRGRLDQESRSLQEAQGRSESYERNARQPAELKRDDEQEKRHHHRRHHDDTDDAGSDDTESSNDSSPDPQEKRKSVVRILDPAKDKEPEVRPKGILRPPREKFPEDPAPIREGVAPLKDAGKKGIPPNARWTKIDRKLVNPEALEMGNERFEERVDSVIVLRVLSKEEIEQYAKRTQEIREMRDEKYYEDRRRLKAIEDSERKYERAPMSIDNVPHEESRQPSVEASYDAPREVQSQGLSSQPPYNPQQERQQPNIPSQPAQSYQQPPVNFQQPSGNYQQPPASFQQPPTNFQQPSNNFQQPPTFQAPPAFQPPQQQTGPIPYPPPDTNFSREDPQRQEAYGGYSANPSGQVPASRGQY